MREGSRYLLCLFLSVCGASAQVDTAWVRTFVGPHGYAVSRLIAVAPSGDVYAAGNAAGESDSSDYLVVKYDASGNLLWAETYAGPGQGKDHVFDLAVDHAGNCYVTGESPGAGTEDDYATVKYRPNGDTAWVRRYNGPAGAGDDADAVAVDDSGNVYVTGYSVGQGTASDVLTVKYDAGGVEQWTHRYNGGSIFIDWAHDIAVDDSGNVYVTGQKGTGFFNYDVLTIKYAPDGDTAWTRSWGGPAGGWDEGRRIALDSGGNAHVFGFVTKADSTTDFVTIKYNPLGDTEWVRTYDGPDGLSEWAQDMAADDAGNVCVVGGSVGSDSLHDYVTVKYSPAGDEDWVHRWGTGQTDIAWGVALGDSDYVYVTGSSDIAPYLANVVTLKLNALTGRLLWLSTYDGPAGGSDAALDVAVGPDGLPCVAGSTSDSAGTGCLTIKYTRTPGIEEGRLVPHAGRLRSTATVVRGTLVLPQAPGFGSRHPIGLLDATGRRAVDLVPGENGVSGVVPGVYFLASGGAESVVKVLVLP